MCEKLTGVQPAARHERICGTDRNRVAKLDLNIQLVVVLQKRPGSAGKNVYPILLPILARQFLGNGLKLIGQTALVGNAVLVGQGSGDSFGVFFTVLPQIGLTAPVLAKGVGNVEHIPHSVGAQQADSLRAAPYSTAHAFVPHIVAGAGRGLRALGVNENLLVIRIFV
ncbi:hypothetical protein [Acutalibacter muris]|uniref:hypothetical protein n=1 Tax=Acutalibacter muris TaxID=1796620 RepID=UPI001C3E9694|nr:hypothetical protein [Acutalibacter muris]